ncbi:MAG: YqiA/YcfP family alpha/beta fold hydrolase [Microcoleaceae cyanobacterium]
MISPATQLIYLHGFASGPQSAKAQYLQERWAERGTTMRIPDLNQDDFFHLSLTRQLQQVEAEFGSDTFRLRGFGSTAWGFERPEQQILIGSSFGGLTAAWLATRGFPVDRMILLAPAFGFLEHWLPQLGQEKLQQWQADGSLAVYHHIQQQELPLGYEFVMDLARYDDTQLRFSVPTLILHGIQDEVIPIRASRDFAANRPNVRLIELDADHSLGNVLPKVWQEIDSFMSNA